MEPNSVVKDVKKLSNYLQHFDANEDLGITSYLKSDQFEIKKLKNSNKLLKKKQEYMKLSTSICNFKFKICDCDWLNFSYGARHVWL